MIDLLFYIFAHTKVFARFIINESTGLMTIKVSRTNDEIGHIEGEETLAIETARIALRQHEGLADNAVSIDVTEIGPREETIVATGTQHEPARVGAPVVERLRILGVCLSHGSRCEVRGTRCEITFCAVTILVHRTSYLAARYIKQPEVGLMMPDAELPVVGEGVAKETSVVGGTGEGYRLLFSLGKDNGVYTVAEIACLGVEVDAEEVIVERIEGKVPALSLLGNADVLFRNHLPPKGRTRRTEIDGTAIGREDRKGLKDRVSLKQW